MKLFLPQNAGITALFLATALLSACGGDNTAEPGQRNALRSGLRSAASINGVVNFSGPRNNYTITRTLSGFTVTDNVGKD